MKNNHHIIRNVAQLVFVVIFIITLFAGYSLYLILRDVDLQAFHQNQTDIATVISDEAGNVVKLINEQEDLEVEFHELPDVFIDALVAAEDLRFFSHDGIDMFRIFSSIIQNTLALETLQGGSTLTQQLIKNEWLSNDRTIERKIKEIYLALKLEQEYSKEEIITLYANRIYFDGVVAGVNHASLRYFNKPISMVTLPEAALLAALVKSPTQYHPIRHPDNALQRRNVVLKTMRDEGYITQGEYETAISIPLEDMIARTASDETAYPYQAYLDIVYEEVEELTGLNPFTTPMQVETYLDADLQQQLDAIQAEEEERVIFYDEVQQLGAAVIDNDNAAIVAVIGGRNYQGERLFNRAYHMKRQPASTIKPIFSYALAMEYLGWSNAHVVEDVPYTYPNTKQEVSNVDARYLGDITLKAALGYSRNTSALSTLESVISNIGRTKTAKFLESINLLDCTLDEVTYSYGLGGMKTGVSPIQLAAAYRVLAKEGKYATPRTIRSIKLLDGSGTELIFDEVDSTTVLSKETAYKMTMVLKEVVDENYWNIGSVGVSGSDIAAKSGTSGFDTNTAAALGYPANASKDIWYAGYSTDYSIAVWTGFDQSIVGGNTYFKAKGDSRVLVAKQVFDRLIDWTTRPNTHFVKPESLHAVNVVLGVYPYVLPDAYTPSSLIATAFFQQDEIPTEVISAPKLESINEVSMVSMNQEIVVSFPTREAIVKKKEYGTIMYDPEKVYGKVRAMVKLTLNGKETFYQSSDEDPLIVRIPTLEAGTYSLECYYQYEKSGTKSTSYRTEFSLSPFDVWL